MSADAGAVATGAGGAGDGGAVVDSGPWGFVDGKSGSLAENWADGLPAEYREAAPSVAVFKNLGDVVKGYHNLKQRLGKAATAAFVPEDFAKATPEELANYRRAVNAPENPEGYQLEGPPQGIPKERWSPELGKQVAALLHKHHAPAALAQDLMAFEAARLQEADAAAQRADEAYKTEVGQALRKAFGEAYETKMRAAQAAAGTIGIDLSDPDPVKLCTGFALLHTMMQDDPQVMTALGSRGGSLGAIGDNPASRATDIMTNKANPYYARYHDNDPEIRALVQNLLKQSTR